MNICYVSNVDISRPNGPGVNEREFVWTLQQESLKRGDRVSFVMPRPVGPVDFTIKNACFYHRIRVSRPFYLLAMFVVVVQVMCRIGRKMKNDATDLFVIRLRRDFLLVPVVLSLLKKRYVIKTLGDVHGFAQRDPSRKLRFMLFFVRGLLRRVLENALFIDVCTPQFKENYANEYSLRRIEVVENSVNVDRFCTSEIGTSRAACGLAEFEKLVGYCGGFPSLRGGGSLVEISGRLVSRYPGCGVLVVGSDNGLEKLKSRAKELGTENRVIFKGVIDYEQIPSLMGCLDVGIALDTTEKTKHVGNSSQKIMQYLACGIRVICAKGTNAEIVKNGFALTVDPNDIDSLFDAVCCWFEKSESENIAFREGACEFARVRLSSTVAYRKRYSLWLKALAAQKR